MMRRLLTGRPAGSLARAAAAARVQRCTMTAKEQEEMPGRGRTQEELFKKYDIDQPRISYADPCTLPSLLSSASILLSPRLLSPSLPPSRPRRRHTLFITTAATSVVVLVR